MITVQVKVHSEYSSVYMIQIVSEISNSIYNSSLYNEHGYFMTKQHFTEGFLEYELQFLSWTFDID